MAARAEEIKYSIDTFNSIKRLLESRIADLTDSKSAIDVIIPMLKKMSENKTINARDYKKLMSLGCPDMLVAKLPELTNTIHPSADCDNVCVFGCPDSDCKECWEDYIENVISNAGEVVDEISKVTIEDGDTDGCY